MDECTHRLSSFSVLIDFQFFYGVKLLQNADNRDNHRHHSEIDRKQHFVTVGLRTTQLRDASEKEAQDSAEESN